MILRLSFLCDMDICHTFFVFFGRLPLSLMYYVLCWWIPISMKLVNVYKTASTETKLADNLYFGILMRNMNEEDSRKPCMTCRRVSMTHTQFSNNILKSPTTKVLRNQNSMCKSTDFRFLAPSGAQGVKMSVCMAQSGLEHSISGRHRRSLKYFLLLTLY